MAILGNQTTPADPYNEALGSLPQIPRRTTGDGTQPGATGAQGTQPPNPQGADDATPAISTLEHASPSDQFRTADALVKSQDRLRKNRNAIDVYHGWLDDNILFNRLDKVPNQNVWIAKLAPGISSERSASVPNKASDLCTKVTDALLADPPKPNPQPHKDDEAADAAANLASEVLRQLAGETGINEIQHYRWALRNALTRSTSYLEYDIDQDGGGYQPYQLLAHPQASDQDLAAAVQANPENPLPLTATDPATGLALPSVDPVLRYVSADGHFVQDASQADRVWLPKLIVRRHHRSKLCVFPPQAAIEDADATILVDSCFLSEGRHRWPETVGAMDSEGLLSLASWKPTLTEFVVPFTFRGALAEGMTGPGLDQVGTMSPLLQRRMYFYRLTIKKSKEYPSGLQLDLSGKDGGFVLAQSSLEYTVTLPTQGSTTRCRDLPYVQVTPQQDVAYLDPTGWPFEARFDGSTKAVGSIIAKYLDALDRMANPHVFIRSLMPITEDEWYDRSRPHVIGPSDQTPFYEQFPELPPVIPFAEFMGVMQDTSSGLTATAQGLDSSNSQSGIAKKLTVRQAQISLAGIQQQLHAAMTRGWRLSLQFIQASFKTPQLIQLTGDEVSDQEQWWTGEDLGGIDEIGIEPGTGTFMTAEDKANYVAFLQGQTWIKAKRAAQIAVTGIARDLGLPVDPVAAAIGRAKATWLKGPPEGWVQLWQTYQQQKQAYDQAQQQYQQAVQQWTAAQRNAAIVAGGAPPITLGPEQQNAAAMDAYQEAVIGLRISPFNPMAQPQPPQGPPPQAPWTPFESRPNDTEPEIADQWKDALSELQMSPRYSAMPIEWRQAADEKYTTCRQALATATGAAPQNPGAGKPHAEQARSTPTAAGSTSMTTAQAA